MPPRCGTASDGRGSSWVSPSTRGISWGVLLLAIGLVVVLASVRVQSFPSTTEAVVRLAG